MYSYEQRMMAVELYIKYYHSAAEVIRELGYPSRHILVKWYKEYEKNHDLKVKRTKRSKYSEEQKQVALDFYENHGHSIKHTIEELGYPGQTVFKEWLNEAFPDRKKYCVSGGAMLKFPEKQKEQAVIDFCARKGSAKEVAEKYGVCRESLYAWRDQLLGKESIAEMEHEKKDLSVMSKDELIDELKSLKAETKLVQSELDDLKREVFRLQLERDVLEKAGELLKKDQGISLTALTNREKAIVIDALRTKHKLRTLLSVLNISKSSYCYQEKSLKKEDKYADLRKRITEIFLNSQKRYGYRRIYFILKNEGTTVSEKVICRIMKEESLIVPFVKVKKYSSYVGEVSPAVDNLVKRNFHADQPNKLWLTDITEFHIPAGKIYLSPMIDCFDGMPVSWTIGTSPSSNLANTMLSSAILTLKPGEHPIVHTDRGGHYRWPGWIDIMEQANLTRSMSKKGCSPDNAACEGFHGRLKNEFFYNKNWQNVSITEFMKQLDEYMHWYCEERIKVSLGGVSPIQYRKQLGCA